MVLWISDFPQPIPSFRVPMVAPDVEPTDAPLVSVCFNYAWLPYILGALNQLTLQSTWSAFTDPPDMLAMRRGASVVQLFAGAYDANCGEQGVPTPYWDEAEDTDDQMGILEQIWYGNWVEGEFVESVGTFAIAGFLAFAGTPAAAVAFLTIAPRFRLAWRTGDLGGIIRVVVDSADMGTVDTYSAVEGVIERDYYGDPELETHQIYQILESV